MLWKLQNVFFFSENSFPTLIFFPQKNIKNIWNTIVIFGHSFVEQGGTRK